MASAAITFRRRLVVSSLALACLAGVGAARGEAPLRVVPQLAWGGAGRVAPDGKLAAGWDRGGHCVELIDVAAPALVWPIPLAEPADAAFSPDGRWLAACGRSGGLLLDLKSARLQYRGALGGQLVRFLPDSRRMLVVRRQFELGRDRNKPRDEGLLLYDLEGKEIARFPLAMEVPHRLEVLPDGKTVRVHGAHGNPFMRAPRMGAAELTVDLETGKSEEKRGPVERTWLRAPPDPTMVKLPEPPKDAPQQRPEEMYWDRASGICVQRGSGRPEGGVLKAWDIRAGRFLATLGRNNEVSQVGGFLGPGVLLANAWKDGQCRVSMLDARTGAVTQTGLERAATSPAPDGRRFTAISDQEQPEKRWLGLYAVPPGEPLFREEQGQTGQAIQAWSPDGKYLVRSPWRAENRVLRVVRAEDGQAKEFPLGELPALPQDGNRLPALWSLAVEGTSGRVAAGLGSTGMGIVAIFDLQSGARQITLDGFPIWVQSLRFLGPDRLLTGTYGGRVQLWDLKQKRPLWTAETGDDVLQFDYVSGGPYLVCEHTFRSATLVAVSDGQIVRRTRRVLGGDSSVQLPWIHPALAGDGKLAVEMAPNAMEVRLVDAATGAVRMTYCAMPGDQWLVYAPDGAWDGSEKVHEQVKFFRALDRVGPAEADQNRSRAKIEAALKAAFGPR